MNLDSHDLYSCNVFFFFFQAEDGIRDYKVTGVQTCALPISDHLLAVFDPALLRLALLNLTQNAIRYSPAGKPITLRAFAEKDDVVVEIADEGPGIAEEHQQKIFERFYRVDKARSRAEGGVGLGLAIVKWSVERMGGTVELDSKIGSGSVFRIRLRAIRTGLNP